MALHTTLALTPCVRLRREIRNNQSQGEYGGLIRKVRMAGRLFADGSNQTGMSDLHCTSTRTPAKGKWTAEVRQGFFRAFSRALA